MIFVPLNFNSNAVGMAVAQLLDFEIDFARNPISGSAAWFYVIIVKFIFTAIFEIKNQAKKIPWYQISFSKPDFYKSIKNQFNLITSPNSSILDPKWPF